MLEFKIVGKDFTMIETLHPVEEMKKLLLKGLQGKLGFPGIIDTTTSVTDEVSNILLQNFTRDFNGSTIYNLSYKGRSDNTIYFDETVTMTTDITIKIN